MPTLRPYHIFISHAWKYGENYYQLEHMLNSASNFTYYNYSAPEDKPLHNLDSTDVETVRQIKSAIDRKISACSCILIISGMYYNHRRWMQYEIETAQRMNKPIIAIKPRGAQIMPQEIMQVADKIVNWYTDSIVAAIREFSI